MTTTTTTTTRTRARNTSSAEALERLWVMTLDERVAAMRAGELTYRQLCAWSARHPEQVPRICTGDGDLFGGEFEWLAAKEPSIAEAPGAPDDDARELDPATLARGERIRARERRRVATTS